MHKNHFHKYQFTSLPELLFSADFAFLRPKTRKENDVVYINLYNMNF